MDENTTPRVWVIMSQQGYNDPQPFCAYADEGKARERFAEEVRDIRAEFAENYGEAWEDEAEEVIETPDRFSYGTGDFDDWYLLTLTALPLVDGAS